MSETVQEKREKALDEVREIREENERRAATHNRVEVHHEIQVMNKDGDEKPSPLEVHAIGGRVYVNSHGEAVLDQDAVITLRKALDAAFQAVS